MPRLPEPMLVRARGFPCLVCTHGELRVRSRRGWNMTERLRQTNGCVSPDRPPAVEEALEAVDGLIGLVRGLPTHGGGRGDVTGQVMVAAYVKSFKRLISVRELGARGAGEDAFILVRSMLSAVARAVWVTAPATVEERRTRFLRYRRKDLEDGLYMIDEGAPVGLEADPSVRENLAEQLAALKSRERVPSLPNDRDLLREVGMEAFYARIYTTGSEHVHMSLTAAMHDLHGAEVTRLEEPQWETAREALFLGFVVFGFLLERSDPIIRHGLTGKAGALAEKYLARWDD